MKSPEKRPGPSPPRERPEEKTWDKLKFRKTLPFDSSGEQWGVVGHGTSLNDRDLSICSDQPDSSKVFLFKEKKNGSRKAVSPLCCLEHRTVKITLAREPTHAL